MVGNLFKNYFGTLAKWAKRKIYNFQAQAHVILKTAWGYCRQGCYFLTLANGPQTCQRYDKVIRLNKKIRVMDDYHPQFCERFKKKIFKRKAIVNTNLTSTSANEQYYTNTIELFLCLKLRYFSAMLFFLGVHW